LPSAAAVFLLFSERPPSFDIPKLELILSFPFHTGATRPHTRRHRPSELPPRWPTPLSRAPHLPPCHPVVRVCATPARLAQRHPEESLVISGCTSSSVSRRRAVGKHATARDRLPRLTSCNPGSVAGLVLCRAFNHFSIVLNFKHCFKLQKFVKTCRNVQNLQNKFYMNPLEPLLTAGLTKLTFTR
jgi:hypothetical protein